MWAWGVGKSPAAWLDGKAGVPWSDPKKDEEEECKPMMQGPTNEYRIRFYNFNMANSNKFKDIADLCPGPGHQSGTGSFDKVFLDPAPDGKPLDLAFVSLVETRLDTKQFEQGIIDKKAQLDGVVSASACEEAYKDSAGWGLRGIAEGLAAGYNGNLVTIVGFNEDKFGNERGKQFFGRLPEKYIAGVSVPNPKKAYTGSTLNTCCGGLDIRITFVGSHFPVEKIGDMFDEKRTDDVLRSAKIQIAKTLRKIMRRAAKRQLLDNSSMLILQGDINSRTVLRPRKGGPPIVLDLLHELLADETLQRAIQADLPVPSGVWREVAAVKDASSLPVTYKFSDKVAPGFEQDTYKSVSIGDIMTFSARGGATQEERDAVKKKEEDKKEKGKVKTPEEEELAIYKKVMKRVGGTQNDELGLTFKTSGFRAFRFPASADRVLCWQPLGLAARTTFELPNKEYEVVHKQGGSDHRPVRLETLMKIGPPVRGGAAKSFIEAGEHRLADSLELPVFETLASEVAEEDGEDSDLEPFDPRTGMETK